MFYFCWVLQSTGQAASYWGPNKILFPLWVSSWPILISYLRRQNMLKHKWISSNFSFLPSSLLPVASPELWMGHNWIWLFYISWYWSQPTNGLPTSPSPHHLSPFDSVKSLTADIFNWLKKRQQFFWLPLTQQLVNVESRPAVTNMNEGH